MERFSLGKQWILEAGAKLRQIRAPQVACAEKSGHQDLVTRYDKQTETFLRTRILARFPDDAIVGEEFPVRAGNGTVWYIDPIDGTTNFISQHRNFAVSIACYQEGQPRFGLVLDAAEERLYWAQVGCGAWRNGERLTTASHRNACRDMLLTTPCMQHLFIDEHPRRQRMLALASEVRAVRSLGSTALELCMVAAGEADICAAMRSSPWDHNAARVILQEAGGSIAALEGGELPADRPCSVLACGSAEGMALIYQRYFDLN